MAIASLTTAHFHPAFDAVVWDFDGTLVASRAADEWAVAMLVARDPGAAEGAAIFWATEGKPIAQRIELAWPGRLAEAMPLFENDVPPVPFRGVVAVLRQLERRGFAQAVVSSRRRHTLEAGLIATGLRQHFELVVSLDDVSEPKPSPEGLLAALRGLGVDPSRSAYVGDSEVDILAGRRAGVTVWQATWAGAADFDAAGAQVLARPREVLEILDA